MLPESVVLHISMFSDHGEAKSNDAKSNKKAVYLAGSGSCRLAYTNLKSAFAVRIAGSDVNMVFD